MRILDAVRTVSEYLEKAGVDDHLADAEILTYHAASIDRMTAFIDNPEIDNRVYAKIIRMAKRRAGGEPVQYIAGSVEFLGLTIHVGKGVLIPRPETEILVEEAIKTVAAQRIYQPASLPSDILDLCTGSGCIALALAKEFPDAGVIGTDVSPEALRYARRNRAANSIRNVTFRNGSLFGPVKRGETFDLITANPPYIVSREIQDLQREVKDWEPVTALDGGDDGLDFYRQILGAARAYLKPAGALVMELGYGQAGAVSEIAGAEGFSEIQIVNDFAGIGRIIRVTPGFPSPK
ncbi:MAG: peptide chain release factor N(5)-glutamine methyltransferase [Nitrospiraceae bacterium]|nr:peptide chain release factor N(5)-glutamine methyltransferase [Nitrospiraceae bacterium]